MSAPEQRPRISTSDGCADGCCTAPAAGRPISGLDAGRRQVLSRRVRLLVAATITYNIIEAIVAIWAGAIASSTALIGFCWAGPGPTRSSRWSSPRSRPRRAVRPGVACTAAETASAVIRAPGGRS